MSTTTMNRPESKKMMRPERHGLSDWFSRDPFRAVREEFNTILSKMSADWDGGWLTGNAMPALDMTETDTAVEIRMDVPGFKPEEIDIEVTENTIAFSGRHDEQHEEQAEDKSFHRTKRRNGSFSRMVALPCAVDSHKVEAARHDGVLTVTLPKSETARSHKVKVKGNGPSKRM